MFNRQWVHMPNRSRNDLVWPRNSFSVLSSLRFALRALWNIPDQTFENGQVIARPDLSDGSLTVVDTSTGTVKVVSNQLEITGSGSWDQTGIRDTDGVTKALGKALFGKLTHNTAAASILGFNDAAGIVRANGMAFEFSAADVLTVTKDDASATLVAVGAVVDATEYELLVAQGGHNASAIPFKTGDTVGDFTLGIRYLIKGGTFTTWTLVWFSPTDATATLYGYTQALEAAAVLSKDLLVPIAVLAPSAMFQPRMLDEFNGTNGDSLRDVHEPDVVAGVSSPGVTAWQSGADSWDIQGNAARNTPGIGGELATGWTNHGANAYETFTSSGRDISSAINTDAFGICYTNDMSGSMTAGKVYRITPALTLNSGTGPTLRVASDTTGATDQDFLSPALTTGSYTFYVRLSQAGTVYVVLRVESGVQTSFSVTGFTVKEVTLDEITATDDLGINEGIFDANLTIPTTNDGFAGIIAHLDDETTPANYIEAIYNRVTGKAELNKYVASSRTSLINVTATYAADAQLRLIAYRSGADLLLRLYYNGALIGTEQTVSDAGIVDNTRHGIISVDSSNTISLFNVARRNDPKWDAEIFRATGGIYP